MLVDTGALIGGLLSVFIILVIALIAVMWYKRGPPFSNATFPNFVIRQWNPSWGRSSMEQGDPNYPTRDLANNMYAQEITMSTLEVNIGIVEYQYLND